MFLHVYVFHFLGKMTIFEDSPCSQRFVSKNNTPAPQVHFKNWELDMTLLDMLLTQGGQPHTQTFTALKLIYQQKLWGSV